MASNLFGEGFPFLIEFVSDVMVYTLKKCGLPETRLPIKRFKENIYSCSNFVTIAGTSILRISLLNRDKWKKMFISRRNSYGFVEENLQRFLVEFLVCWPLEDRNTVELYFAICNEIIMFFHHESIDIDVNLVVKSIAKLSYIILGYQGNFQEKIQEKFTRIYNISRYTRQITDFMIEFAIPYGARSNVSDLFLEHVEKLSEDYRIRTHCQKKPLIKELEDRLGFLPHDFFSDLVFKETVTLPENFEVALGGSLPGDRESPEPPKLPASSKNSTLKRKKLREWRPTRPAIASLQTAQNRQGSKDSLELKILQRNCEQMCLSSEKTSQEINGTIRKQKMFKKKNGRKKRKMELPLNE